MAVIDELIENLIMANDMLYEDDHTSAGKLDEDEGDKEEEKEPENRYAEFERYMGLLAKDLREQLFSQTKKAFRNSKSELPKTFQDKIVGLAKDLDRCVDIVKGATFDRRDPNSSGNQEVNNIMASVLASFVTIRGTLMALKEWTVKLNEIIIKEIPKEKEKEFQKVLLANQN